MGPKLSRLTILELLFHALCMLKPICSILSVGYWNQFVSVPTLSGFLCCLIKIVALTIKFITEQTRSTECCSRGSKVIMCTAGSSASEPGRSCPISGARSWCPDPDPEKRESSRDRSSPFTGPCRKSWTTTSPKTTIRPWPFACFSWRIFHSITKFVAPSRL